MKTIRPILYIPAAALGAILLSGCGGSESAEATRDITEEVRQYYATKVSLPPSVFEALEAGSITSEEIDRRTAEGEFPLFFQFKTPADIPDDLVWENGLYLSEFASPEARKGGTLHASIQDFPRTLRTVGPDSNGGFRPFLLDNTQMWLAHRHPNNTAITETGFHYFPGLAREWAVDKANKTVYVRLHEEATWSDGEPITADDMLFMFFFFQSDYINAPWYNNWYNRNYTGIIKYDERTFSISVPEAKPDMKSRVLGLRPVPEHFYKELGPDFVERYQWQFAPTTGPYIVRDGDIQKGRSITMTRNEDWWARDMPFWRYRFNYDRIHITVIRDIAKAFETFRAGELDGFGMSLAEYHYDKFPDSSPEVQNGYVHKLTFYNDIPRPTFAIRMNTAQPLLDNRDIRVGIQHALNWDLVIEKYFRGDAARMNTTADGYGEFTHPSLEARGYDVEKALASFSKAGFNRRGPNGILLNEAGQSLSFTLTTGYKSLENMLPILKEEAAKAGLELRLEVLDSTASFKKQQEKKHELSLMGFGVGPEMYPRYWENYHGVNAYDKPYLADGSVNPERQPKPQTNNLMSIALPPLDRRIEQYRASEDLDEMKNLAFEMEEIIYDYASFSPGWYQPFFRAAVWRWIRYPEETYNVKLAESAGQYYLNWIDEEMKEETLAAMRSGDTFAPVIRVYDQYKLSN